ncbi:thermonuclease family protein [uncultured Clostridium sp.]|jgi:micrococcal nuclease|uniref:thermonuclease family protein n=1 Tax=uncultured Clostridium sp. TaxID=59620 RepID=UPI0026125DCD|nr:thermonuclease family protein [uncultured Clostridium sp.]
MKKTLIIIGILVAIGGAYYIGSHKENHRAKENYNNQSYSQQSNQGDKNYSNHKENTNYNNMDHKESHKSNNKYSEVDGVPFNKGYNNDYDKAAVEKANKEHSKVTLNNEFRVEGVENVRGATNCKYIRDIDGDTLVANVNGEKKTIRFFGVDTAEDVNPKIHCIEPYSIQGKEYVESKLEAGDNIKILFNESKGKYGREVGTIFYENNGKWYNLNEEEVANGLARIAYLNKNNATVNVNEYYKAEDSAKSQKLNIWSIPGYVTRYGYNLAIFK